MVTTYLVMQAQSAQCEAMLSKRSHIKRSLMGQGDAESYNRFAQVQSNVPGGLHSGVGRDILRKVVAAFMAAKPRRSASSKQIPLANRFRFRVRVVHSDCGVSDKRSYKKRAAAAPSIRNRSIIGSGAKFRRLDDPAPDGLDAIFQDDPEPEQKDKAEDNCDSDGAPKPVPKTAGHFKLIQSLFVKGSEK